MEFRKYQKLERFGMTSVENIEIGKVSDIMLFATTNKYRR